ncbi:SBBP repeat-containing protein [Kordiimonas marina]|uniref:SBBP repeat-containing protein n=1 Tax=Kordiimonas marina TaxID=2872312 RepID=UPI001FF36F87|nr:SBBP repeat-containing protein [Kordiimonas marina]MCJ9428087.1 SBBP repeat-containing protein [Kordiimonas marina]
MAFFGTVSSSSLLSTLGASSGGLFGTSSGSSIVGIDYSLISASIDSQNALAGLSTLSAADRAAYNFRGASSSITTPWQQDQANQSPPSLNEQVRKARSLTKFIDLNDPTVKSVSKNPDKQATFALYKALSNLRVLAEYASQNATPTTSLARLDTQFQSGLNEVRNYLSNTQLDKLGLFLGDKAYKADTSIQTGHNATSYGGSFITNDPNAAISGLTGTEVFNVAITKSGVTDNITVDLSKMTGTLSLNNIKDYINTQISSLTILDATGNPVPKDLTRFSVHRNTTTGQYGLQVDGVSTEQISLSAASSSPSLYIASSVAQVSGTAPVTSRLTEIGNLSGTMTVDHTTSFAGVDIAGSAIKQAVANDKTANTSIDPKIAALRDKMKSAALLAVTGSSTTTTATANADALKSITDITSKNKVTANTQASKVAVDSEGGVYVVGKSQGSFNNQINTATGNDVFLTKFDNQGNVIFSRLLGVSGDASAYGVTVDSNDNVIVTGQTDSALSTSDVIAGKDAFVTKYTKTGDEVFRYQLDTAGESAGTSVTVDSNNDIYVGGYTKSGISATSGFSGGQDAMILKVSGTTGKLIDSNVFGTAGNDVIKGIQVDSNNNLVVAAEQSGNAKVYRIDSTNLANQTASIDFGALGSGGAIQGLSIDNANNSVYLAGTTTNGSLNAGGTATVNGAAAGGFDGFVSGVTLSGTTALTANFTTYLGTASTDRIADVKVSGNTVYVAGSTSGTFAGEVSHGATDAFVARVDGATGTLGDIQQFGESLSQETSGGIAFTNKGNSVLSTLGLPTGSVIASQTLNIQTQTSAQVGDYFYFSLGGGIKHKITLQAGDDLRDISRKLNIAGFGKLKASVATTTSGDKLTISTLATGQSIDLIAGANGRDLLSHLGIQPGKLLNSNEVYGIKTAAQTAAAKKDPSLNIGGVFGLGLGGAINIGDKPTAKYTLNLLDKAISTIERAYRTLDYNPLVDKLKNGTKNTGGGPSPEQAKQLANLQTGLARLTAGSSSSSYSLFA